MIKRLYIIHNSEFHCAEPGPNDTFLGDTTPNRASWSIARTRAISTPRFTQEHQILQTRRPPGSHIFCQTALTPSRKSHSARAVSHIFLHVFFHICVTLLFSGESGYETKGRSDYGRWLFGNQTFCTGSTRRLRSHAWNWSDLVDVVSRLSQKTRHASYNC